MNSFDLFKMGIKNLLRRKLRTFLTALGIVIGTVSIVVMVSLGIGMTKQMDDWVKDMGDVTVIEVSPRYDAAGKKNNNGEYIIPIEDIEKIKAIADVEAVTPQLRQNVKLISGKFQGDYLNIIGIDMSVADKFGLKIKEGRMPNDSDRVAIVVGSEVPFRMVNPRKRNNDRYSYGFRGGMDEEERVPDVNMLEDRLYYTFDMNYGSKYSDGGKRVKPEKIDCVGILDSNDWQIKSNIYMDVELLKELKVSYDRKMGQYKKERNEGYTQLKVKVNDVKKVKEVQEAIKKLGYEANGMLDMVDSIKKQSQTTQMIFGGIGGISLLVAAIGITNTMIMAIYERRKEIGVMKVIGARIKDIKRLFLLESAAIGFVGGVLGLLASMGLSKLINTFASSGALGGMGMGGTKISIIPPWLAMAALGFTAMIGLISGYLPARKAMKLSALEAIKNE